MQTRNVYYYRDMKKCCNGLIEDSVRKNETNIPMIQETTKKMREVWKRMTAHERSVIDNDDEAVLELVDVDRMEHPDYPPRVWVRVVVTGEECKKDTSPVGRRGRTASIRDRSVAANTKRVELKGVGHDDKN